GMSDKLGPRTFGERQEMVFLGRDLGEQRNYSEDIASEIDQEVHHLVETAFLRAKEVLRRRENILRVLAARLTEVETMEGAEMKRIIDEIEGTGEPAGSELGEVAAGGCPRLGSSGRVSASPPQWRAATEPRPGRTPPGRRGLGHSPGCRTSPVPDAGCGSRPGRRPAGG